MFDSDYSSWYQPAIMSSAAFNTHSVTFRDLLNPGTKSRIIIPPFQRGYEWKLEQVKDFWKDIFRFHQRKDLSNSAKTYFLGPIVCLQTSEDSDREILDGQQRIVTATILFSVIRDLASNFSQAGKEVAADTQKQTIVKDDGSRMLHLSETDDTYFKETVQEYPTKHHSGRLLRTHKKIRAAQSYLRDELSKICPTSNPVASLELLKGIRTSLFNSVKLAAITVDSNRDAIQIFTTLNNRGLKLAVPDLFLAYLLGKEEDRVKRDTIRELWSTMIGHLGAHDVDRFFRHFWVSRKGDIKEDLFEELQAFVDSGNDIETLVRDCVYEAEIYVAIVESDEKQLHAAAKPIKNLLGHLGARSALPLLLSAHLSLDASDFEKLCQTLIVFNIRYYIAAKFGPDGMESILFALAKAVREKKGNNVPSKEILRHVVDSLVKITPSDEEFQRSFPDIKLNPGQAKYMLRALANYIESPAKEKQMDESNLEHIYPQNPAPDEWGGLDNQEILGELTWNIGNLTIFGKRANSKAQNKEFHIKKPLYLKSKVVMTLNMANQYSDWNSNTIKERATHLAPKARDVWDFNNPTRV